MHLDLWHSGVNEISPIAGIPHCVTVSLGDIPHCVTPAMFAPSPFFEMFEMYIISGRKNIIWHNKKCYLALGQDLPFFLYCAMYPLPWVPIPCKWIITIMCEQVWYHLQFELSMLPFSVWNLQFATGCSLSEGGALWVWRMEPGSIHWDNNVWHICVYCTLYDIFVKGPSIETSVHYALYLVPCAVNIVQCAVCLAVHSVEDEGRVRPLRPPAQPSGPDTSAAQNLLSTQTHWNSLLCTYMIYTNTQVLIYKQK